MLQRLFDTTLLLLVEASPFDKVWGFGLDATTASITPQAQWKGTNWLGEVLTQVSDDTIAFKPFIVEDYEFINF